MRGSHLSFASTVRRSLLIIFTFFAGVAFFADSRLAQPAQERPVWDVQLARNTQAKSKITIQNQCKLTHSFTVIERQTPFIQLLSAQTFNVPGNSSYDLPVQFNTNGMNAGQYQGTVVVKCDTCGKEKGCTQDKEILPVRLVVLQEDGPQMTPENPTQPQAPVPPIVLQEKPVEKPVPPKPTPTPTTGNGSTRQAYGPDGKPIKDDKRDFEVEDQKSYPVKECAECSVPQVVEEQRADGTGKEKSVQCSGECIGGANCKVPDGYSCNLFIAQKAKEKGQAKPPKWKKATGGRKTKADDSGKTVYTCACSK